MNRRTHVVLSDELVKEIDELVGAGSVAALSPRPPNASWCDCRPPPIRRLAALDQLEAWSGKDHPELKQGAAKYVRKLRQEYERRFQKVTAR